MLETLILEGIPDARVRIEDPRGDGTRPALYVASPVFRDLSLVEQHRMVHKALGELPLQNLAAISIRTFLPGK